MDEAQVKVAVLNFLRRSNSRTAATLIASEFPLRTSGVRVDLAVFYNQSLAIEIKTNQDTLTRLTRQMAAYSRYFETSIVVAAPRHVQRIGQMDLSGAAIWTYDDRGAVAKLTPGTKRLEADLSKHELLTQLEVRNEDFSSAIEKRYGHTSRSFWSQVAGRSIKTSDISSLSRFHKRRTEARALLSDREARWSRWIAAQAAFYPCQSSSVSSAESGSE